jgi:prolyl-tRNA editing enzyme YbaK/EbsC (Cys-tRNA(Pro) deacylase)
VSDRGDPGRAVLEHLARLGAEYEVIPIDPAFADTAAFCERYGYAPERSANTILVASKKEPKSYAACVVLATTQLDVNRRVRGLLGVSRASFASPEEMKSVLGMEVGGVTPFGLPPGMPLYVDARVFACEWIILGGGGRATKIRLSPEALRLVGGESVEGLAVERREASPRALTEADPLS